MQDMILRVPHKSQSIALYMEFGLGHIVVNQFLLKVISETFK